MSEDAACGTGPRLAQATPGEIPEVADLAAATLREAWSAEGFAAARRQPGAMLLVARAVAGAGAPLLGFLAAQRVLDELHVFALATRPEARRRGIARALLACALDSARSAGARVALLEVRASNVAACAFYTRYGFRVVGRRPRYYADGEDALLMDHQLAAGSLPLGPATRLHA